MVYFISAGGWHPIKIGYSLDPLIRCATLQAGSPVVLGIQAMLPGNQRLERHLHRRFAAGRLESEWFDAMTPGLDRLIEAARHFEGFWPEDTESPLILEVLAEMGTAGYVPPREPVLLPALP